MNTNLKLGTLVPVRVDKLLPIGLLVSLENGRKGLIREREISWNIDERRAWRVRFKIGECYDALVLDAKPEQPELSLRLARSDPWLHVEERYRTGTLVKGIVATVDTWGAFVELEPAVEGLLHRNGLPSWLDRQHLTDHFWVGDDVMVVVENVNPAERRIDLSMTNIRQFRWPNLLVSERQNGNINHTSQSTGHSTVVSSNGTTSELPLNVPTPTRSFLLVEDSQGQRSAIAHWLRNEGHQVYEAGSVQEALAVALTAKWDIALVDIGLPDGSGLQLIQDICRVAPDKRHILMSDWGTVNKHQEELYELAQIDIECLTKPIEPEDLIRLLRERPLRARKDSAKKSFINGDRVTPKAYTAHRTQIDSQIAQVMRLVRQETKSNKAVLFAVDPHQRQVQIAAESGSELLNHSAIPNLIYSPVREAVEEARPIWIEDTDEKEAYVNHLLPLLEFRSCIGVPIEAELPKQYALFLFSDVPRSANDLNRQFTTSAAMRVAALLERRYIRDQMFQIHGFALLGHLSRALVHETNNYITPILFSMSYLRKEVSASHLEKMDVTVRNLKKTVMMFGEIADQGKQTMINVGHLVEKCIMVLRDVTDRAKIVVRFDRPAHVLLTYLNETQVQQILLNILLNAEQQIERIRPREGGFIRVDMSLHRIHGERFICIRIEDDGPGIHHNLWRRIFDLGFTTRGDEGSGMGLYIAKQLMDDIGGQLIIDGSYVGWGSAFQIRLPVVYPKAGGEQK